jgi:DNA replication protein DnaC
MIARLKGQFSDDDGVLTVSGGKLIDAVQRYYEANIPADYWLRDMGKFQGSKVLSNAYNDVIKSVDDAYIEGVRLCFAGQHGTGKTMTGSCILKRVVETGKYSALYVNLTDIVNLMTSQSSEKLDARKMLLSVDFLMVDEFDDRFMGTDNAADLFGRILEPVLRSRIQNQLPLILCTNSPNVVSSFTGPLRASIQSLMRVVRIVPVLDKDHRLEEK